MLAMRLFPAGTALAALIVGCGSGTEPRHLATIHMHFSRDTVAINDTVQGSVAGLDQFGSQSHPDTITWRSSDPAVATVDASGLVLGVSVGATMITAAAAPGISESRWLYVAGTLHTQPITTNEVWTLDTSPHWVRGHITVGSPAGAVLTLEAGTTVRFFEDAGLDFGAPGPGRLVADGGATEITLRLFVDVGTYWAGLTFQGPGQSVMRNLKMWGCGGLIFRTERPCVVLKDVGGVTPPTLFVDSVTISNSLTSGVSLEGGARFAAGSRKLSIYGINGSIGIVPLAAAESFPAGGVIGGSTDNSIHLVGDSISDSLTLPRLGVGWYLARTLVVAGPAAPVLTIPDSSRVIMEHNAALIVGRGAPGGIQVGGSAGTVVIQSEGQYNFPGVQLWSEALPSAFRRTVFHLCSWCISVDGNGTGPEILADSVVIVQADGAGIKLAQGGRFAPGSRKIMITGTTGVPMYVAPGAIHTIPAGVYTGNQYDAIVLWGSDVQDSETWPNLGIPYSTGQYLVIQGANNPVLTLEPGVVLRTREVGEIWVGVSAPGGLRAMGTAAAPVRITGESDPSASGFWRGIYIGPQADSSTLFSYATVENAGAFDGVVGAAIHIDHDFGEIVKNTVIRWSSGCGIARASGTWTTDFTAPQLANQFVNVTGAAQCGP